MKLGRDLVASLTGSLGTVVATLVAVPYFIHFLGVDGFGLVGFNTVLQGVLLLLDLGISQTISRQVARDLGSDDRTEIRTLLRTLGCVYWAASVGIGIVMILLAPLIAQQWLSPGEMSADTVTQAVTLIGLQVACRWPSGLYLGTLLGARQVVAASSIGLAYTIATSLGAVAVLAYIQTSLQALFLYQAVAALIYSLVLQRYAWRALGGTQGARFKFDALRAIWRFAAGMSGIAVVSVIATQVDKMALSNLVSLEDFGHYMLATLVASSLYRITAPIFNVVYPLFSELVSNGQEEHLRKLYRIVCGGFAILWFPLVGVLAAFAEPLLALWTGDIEVARRTAPLLTLIAAGTGLHGMMWFPYALLLAYGATRLIFVIHIILLLVEIALIFALAVPFGAVGGALAWLLFQATYMALGTALTYRNFLRGIRSQWIINDVGRPLLVSVVIGVAATVTLSDLNLSPAIEVGIGALLAGVAVLISASLSPHKLRDFRNVLSQ